MKSGANIVRHFVVIILWVCLTFATASDSLRAHAQTGRIGINGATDQGHVTILILDMSGSMGNNDPQEVRCSAADAYIDLSKHGDEIGVVALTSGNEHVSGLERAQVWQEPTPMDVVSEREQLKRIIQNRPPGTPSCQHPSGNTPTFDALRQALRMLGDATGGKNVQGSAILLTDGQPFPDSGGQIQAIESDLIPQFQKHHWAIDTIALGTELDFHPLLKAIASRTGGISYDDAKGSVSNQSSPLNITPFFITIFSQRVGSTLSPVASLGSLKHSATAYNFTLDNYAQHLDIVVVKDRDISSTLTSPSGNLVLPSKESLPGIFVVTDDPYYEIFSIEGPRVGIWQLNLSGTGQFLVDSLIVSRLQVSILSPSQDSALLPFGLPLSLVATLTDAQSPGTHIAESGLSLAATITFQSGTSSGSSPFTARQYMLERSGDTFQTTINMPSTTEEGTYTITIAVTGETSAVISSATRTIRIAQFPEAVLSGTVMEEQLDALMRVNPVTRWLGFTPSAEIAGTIQLNGKTYVLANVTKAALYTISGKHIAVLQVIDNGRGHFQLLFPALPSGTYRVELSISGTFQELSGQLGTDTQTVHLTSEPMTWLRYGFVIGVTAISFVLILLILAMLLSLLLSGPMPSGECIRLYEGERHRYEFANTQRRYLVSFRRNTLYSEEVYMKDWQDNMDQKLKRLPEGLRLRFYRDGKIKVHRSGPKGKFWKHKDQNGEKEFSECHCSKDDLVLVYSPMDGNAPLTPSEITIRPRQPSTYM